MTTAEAEGRARRIAGQEREERLDRERRQKAAKRQEAQKIWDWVCERFPVEKRSQACVAFYVLRDIHGKGNVTLAMVKRRMKIVDERFGICDEAGAGNGD